MIQIVFDFDGTMADSKQLAIDIYNELAEARGYKRIERQKISMLSSLSIPDRMKELNIPAVHLPKLVFDFKKIYKRNVHTLSAVEGISDLLLGACKRVGIKMIAVTWGFDSKELLQNAKPDFVANEPHEITEKLGFR